MDRFYDQAKLGPMIERRAAELQREAETKAKEEAARREDTRRSQAEGIKQEDDRRAAIRREHDDRMAAERAVAVAAVRENVERDLRRGGVAEADIPRLANRAMDDYHARAALEAATLGDRRQRALEDYFRRRPAPAFPERDDPA